ncbi:MAG: DoxX-like family protein [Cyclobacteriaceae bacterium]|nr:DoxX-like family protein [Cyclobacteriaceae bacterium]
MTQTNIHRLVPYFTSLIWLVNGLFCKVLNLVPRHEQIVSRILGHDHSRLLTISIGLSEILMSAWILSGLKKRLCAVTQIVVVAIMNTLEFIVVPDLLLWGRLNSLFAFLFILLIYYNEFVLNKQITKPDVLTP